MSAPRRIYDVTLPLASGMPQWPTDPPFVVQSVKSLAKGDSSNLSQLQMTPHTGTHVDAPRHMLEGAPTVETLDLEALCGPALLFDWPHERDLEPADLPPADELAAAPRFLLRTGAGALHARGELSLDFPALSVAAARELVARGVRLFGVDALSVDRPRQCRPPGSPPGHPVHETLLAAGLVVVEGLQLEGVPPGRYELLCLPLKLVGLDGAPARALLRELKA